MDPGQLGTATVHADDRCDRWGGIGWETGVEVMEKKRFSMAVGLSQGKRGSKRTLKRNWKNRAHELRPWASLSWEGWVWRVPGMEQERNPDLDPGSLQLPELSA